MFVLNDDMSIYATRGDTVFFTVGATDGSGEKYKFKPDDVVRFKAFEKKACENVVAQKDFVITEETEEVNILLTEDDTRFGKIISKPRDYWYEIELNPFTNPQTIIGYDDDGPKVFRLYPESKNIVKDISEEDFYADAELSMTSTNPVQNQAVTRAVANLTKHIDDGLKGVKESVLSEEEALRIRGELRRLDAEVTQQKSDFTEYQTSTNNSIKQTNDKVNVLESRPVNNNILINSNFANPVNQRGKTSYPYSGTGNMYTIDRWYTQKTGVTVTPISGGLKVDGNDSGIAQRIEAKSLYGKVVTGSFKVSDGNVYTFTCTLPNEGTTSFKRYAHVVFSNGNFGLASTSDSNVIAFYIDVSYNSSITIEWAKLEIGNHATPYVPRLYGEEFELCQRYYSVKRAVEASLFGVTSTTLCFNYNTGEMRIKPTVDYSECIVNKNDTEQTGFTFNQPASYGNGGITFFATKESGNHNLSETSLLTLGGLLKFDAEL